MPDVRILSADRPSVNLTSMAKDRRRHTELEKQPRGVRFLHKSPDGTRTELALL